MTVLATSDDTIYRGRLRLSQPKEGYRFGTDAMLLAASVQAKPGEKVLELGCGVGAVLLAAQSRLKDVFFTGIEREEAYATLAHENCLTNQTQDSINVICGDLQDKSLFHSLGMFDHVISNPPYCHVIKHSGASNSLRRKARQEEGEGLGGWIQAANRFLKPKGTLTLIYPVERLDEMIQLLSSFAGNITIFPLWPQQGIPAKRMLIKAVKGSKSSLRVLPGLVLHKADGGLTEEADLIINDGRKLIL